MNHLTQVPRRRNLRAFVAALITYVMLAGQVAPLALAASPARVATPSESAPPTSVSFSQRPAPAPLPPGGGGPLVGSPTITATKVDAWDGTATFTYTITDAGGKTDTATATISVGNGTSTPGANVVWFVNPSAASGGDGRLTNPFNCYTGGSASCFSTTAADDPGDAIFLFSGAHTGGNTLLNRDRKSVV